MDSMLLACSGVLPLLLSKDRNLPDLIHPSFLQGQKNALRLAEDSGLTEGAPIFLAAKASFRMHSRNHNKNALISVFRIDFCRSLESGLLTLARFLSRGW